MSTNKPYSVFVEGNIASGKSTFLNYLKSFNQILVLEEDLNKWTHFHGYNLLELKLKDPDRFQFPFQSIATLTRLRQHLLETSKPIKVMERSLISARKCFVESLKAMDLLHEGMYHVLQEWYDYIDEYHNVKVDLFIYIQTEPEIAFKRINSRARKEESSVTLEYLKQLHKIHEEVFVEKSNLLPAEVLIIDGNLSEEEMINEYKKVEAKILTPLAV